MGGTHKYRTTIKTKEAIRRANLPGKVLVSCTWANCHLPTTKTKRKMRNPSRRAPRGMQKYRTTAKMIKEVRRRANLQEKVQASCTWASCLLRTMKTKRKRRNPRRREKQQN